jgi:hypothetical protein
MTHIKEVKSIPSLTEAKGSLRQAVFSDEQGEGSQRQKHGLNVQCRPRIREDGGSADMRRVMAIGTSPQHRTRTSICRMVIVRRSDNRMRKAVGITPGEPVGVARSSATEGTARCSERLPAVSRERKRYRTNEPGVGAEEYSLSTEESGRSHLYQRLERCLCRMVRVNERGQ